MNTTGAPPSIDGVVEDRSIIVCCGSGGVGKTTTAAALAFEAARRGRNACVVTIDPARRLADALGLDELTNAPTKIEGDWSGSLHALMLDPKATFDDLVTRYADTEEQAQRIRQNRIYRNLTSTLSGTQEYMASEKLYELTEEGAFDVVVVDTPPTRNALDFLEAPGRLTRFLDNRLFQALMKPTRAGLRFVGVAAHAVLRTISRVAGADIVTDAVTFFQAFEGMEEGFRQRAARVRELLREPDTAYLLVASPRPDSVDEAVHFADKLGETGMTVSALVVNRVQPRFAEDSLLDRLAARLEERGGRPVTGTDGPPTSTSTARSDSPTASTAPADGSNRPPAAAALEELVSNLRGYTSVSDREEQTYAELLVKVHPAPVYKVPLLETDVHDVSGLEAICNLLFSPGVGSADFSTSLSDGPGDRSPGPVGPNGTPTGGR